MRPGRSLIPAFVAGALLLGAASASAGPTAQADLHIKKAGRPFKGDDVINLTGQGQTVRKVAAVGETAKFKFRVENDGFAGGQIFVRGNGSNAHFKVRYRTFFGDDLTPQMLAGAANFTLAPGARGLPVTILVTPKAGAPLGAVRTVKVTATHATVDDDRVRARVENGLPGE